MDSLACFLSQADSVRVIDSMLAKYKPDRQRFATAFNGMLQKLQSRQKSVLSLVEGNLAAQTHLQTLKRNVHKVTNSVWKAIAEHPERHHPEFTVEQLKKEAMQSEKSGFQLLEEALRAASEDDLERVSQQVSNVLRRMYPARGV